MWEGFFDGSCDNNGEKEMQIGAVLLRDGKEVEKISRKVGIGTSNIAEYLALIALLECIDNRKIYSGEPLAEVSIYGDSLLVINQVTGLWRVKANHLRQYRDWVREINRKVVARFSWIPRERNTRADRLSKCNTGVALVEL